MAKTYEPIATTTASGSSATITFNSIPATFTDLILVMNTTNGGNSEVRIRLNGDTSSNYSRTLLSGNGSVAYSIRSSGATYIGIDSGSFSGTAQGQNAIVQFMNYANTTTYKTVISRANNAGYGLDAEAALWRKTPEAITSIEIFNSNASNWTNTSTFTLYGIKAA